MCQISGQQSKVLLENVLLHGKMHFQLECINGHKLYPFLISKRHLLGEILFVILECLNEDPLAEFICQSRKLVKSF